MYKKCIKKYINKLDKGKAIWYIYIILVDRYAKHGHLALMATTDTKRVLRRGTLASDSVSEALGQIL